MTPLKLHFIFFFEITQTIGVRGQRLRWCMNPTLMNIADIWCAYFLESLISIQNRLFYIKVAWIFDVSYHFLNIAH